MARRVGLSDYKTLSTITIGVFFNDASTSIPRHISTFDILLSNNRHTEGSVNFTMTHFVT